MTDLVLGPLLRHVGEHTAAIWVETADPATVTVTAGEHQASARTFGVHGHHYALVTLDGLEKGTKTPYRVACDGEPVWPLEESIYPDSVIPTLDHDKPLRLAFGSCRTSVAHDSAGNKLHGVDALRAYALRMSGVTDTDTVDDPDPGPGMRWPDLVLFLGDQVYADETSTEMQTFIEARRDIEEPPWTELKDYAEYAQLYKVAWSDPVNRWLLSTLPSAMIFDDHDIRDDWNTSLSWKQEMESTDWWHDRIVAGLASYWVHQHLGNLPPEEREREENWQQIIGHAADAEEFDASAMLDAFAERADQKPDSYRWSFTHDLGRQARLVVIDSRAARVLDPDNRSMLDDTELAWLDEQLRGDVDHLLIGTSLPFLLTAGLHYVEAFTEALAGGAWGERWMKLGERMRQSLDLEHWAAFQDGFQALAAMVLEVARGERGRAPRTVTFLSGDVHHSYVADAHASRQEAYRRPQLSRILQAVCSPIRNQLPVRQRMMAAGAAYGIAGPIGRLMARSAKVPAAPLRWSLMRGPWFDNNLATLEVTTDGLRMWWAKGKVDGDTHHRPRLVTVADVTVDAPKVEER